MREKNWLKNCCLVCQLVHQYKCRSYLSRKPVVLTCVACPMSIQPMGSFRGLDFGLPRLSRAEIEQINIDSQIGQINDMVRSGISPSGRRVKELVAACAQKGQISAYADDLLACIGDILKLEEETCRESSPDLKEALVLADLGGNYFQL